MTEIIIVNVIGFCGAGILLWLITKQAGTSVTLAHLFSLFWGPCILAAQFYTTFTDLPGTRTLAVLFGAWWALLCGFLATIDKLPATKREITISKYRTIAAIAVLFVLQALIVIHEMPSISISDPLPMLVLALRDNTDVVDPANKVPWYLEIFRNSSFVYIPLAMLMKKRNWISWRLLSVLIGAAGILALARMTRAPLMADLTAVWASWTVIYSSSLRRSILVTAVAVSGFGVIFLTVQTALETKDPNGANDTVGMIQAYYGGSMQAFESILDGTFPREDGYYSADMFYYVLNKLQLVTEYPSLIRPYAANGTNIYTFLDAFTLDGGVLGALLGAGLVGLAGGWISVRAFRHNSLVLLTAYGMFAYFLAIAVANNEFIRISPVLTIILASMIQSVVVKREPSWALTSGRAVPTSARSFQAGRSQEHGLRNFNQA